MSVLTNASHDGSTVTISVSGRFDFKIHDEFEQAYAHRPQGPRYVVDLDAVDYMDSSALGMLLLLREHAGDDTTTRIVNCSPDVRKILGIANFQTLFEIV